MHSLPSRAGLGLALLLASGSIASAQIVHNPANGHYYEAAQAPTIASWHEARREAHTRTHLGLKGHLVTITDAAENAFVLGLPGFVEDFWIGGYQDTDDPSYSEPGGGWKWVTGEPFSYTDWGLGQPNNSLGGEDHLNFDSVNRWYDFHEDSQQTEGYIVEYEAQDFSYDSGAATGAWGGGNQPNVHAFFHGFDSGLGNTVTDLEVAYGTALAPGSCANGLPVTLGIWDDPTNDFDPSDAVLLWSTTGVTSNACTDILNSYGVPSIPVSGVFFVGAAVEHDGDDFPIPLDPSATAPGIAWRLTHDDPPTLDLEDLTNNSFGPIDQNATPTPTVYLIRAKGKGGAPLYNSATGNYYRTVEATGTPWWLSHFIARDTTFQGAPGHLVTITSQQENDFVASLRPGPDPFYWVGGHQDSATPDYSEPDGGWRWITGEPLTFLNWNTNEPDDAGAGEERMAMDLNGAWSDRPNGILDAPGYVIEYSMGANGQIGTAYCLNGDANSVSSYGALLWSVGGFGTSAAEFLMTDLPNQPGILFAGPNEISIPFGCGTRCVGGSVVRFGVVGASGGTAMTTVDMSAPGLDNIQFWYRDPANQTACGATWNLTNALH